MSQYDGSDDASAPESESERVRTGVEAVDDVLDSVDDLRERPLAEHPPVFEAAHERLRRALDPTDPADRTA